ARLEGGNASFEASPTPSISTRSTSSAVPDKLYNLEILQYDSNGNYVTKQTFGTETTPGTALTVNLNPKNDCQLLIVARGSGNALPSISTNKSLNEVRNTIATSSVIEGIDPSTGSLNAMPYVLHLERVNVVSDNSGGMIRYVLQSPEGTCDTRLRLKRLATKLTVNWTFSPSMADDGYVLKEVRLCQVPKDYRLLPTTEKNEWGITYPTTIAEFVNPYRLTSATDLNKGGKTIWLPANVRGTSVNATSDRYRTKENAPTAASYVELVVDNSTRQERLYYRAYLGGDNSTDFNLYENKDYNWTLNIKSADYRGDARIQLLDQTPVKSTNLVPTSNCLMMLPGTNICFNPYKHEAGANGWNTYLTDGTTLTTEKTIDHVRVLWQTKDAGTSGELVLGYVVDENNHKNLVNVSDIADKDKALVHVKVPVTQGGNAVIEAVNASGVTVWSWHIWISDYIPVGVDANKITDNSNRTAAISEAQNATQGGAVQVYQGISWTEPAGAFYKCVIMDRNLGATKAGIQDNQIDGRRTLGMLYQGGRKDPFFAAADGTTKETKTIYDGVGEPLDVTKGTLSTVEQLIQQPLKFAIGSNGQNPTLSEKWNGDGPKTIYDPCPKGWRVPSNGITPVALGTTTSMPLFNDDGTFKYCMWTGFGINAGTTGAGEGNLLSFNNVMYYDGNTRNISFINISTIQKSDFVGSGFIYYGTSVGPEGDKSIFFPGVSLRELNSGNYRDKKNNTAYLWSSTKHPTDKGAVLIYQIQDNIVSVRHPIDWKFGFSVRCVQDNIQKKP
ncbi:hypothetical protein, partial [uncultured Bacteroides sp.]|uniref:DUF4906 domain-containing protein n=1 Tax=uncultured Bacteroides sp. TaxID=162156 RepID=UPI0025E28387